MWITAINLFKIIFELEKFDLFINNAHPMFDQTRMLMEVFDRWKYKDKTIVNIISRAKYDNISKGFMYSASKASLSHLSHNLRFNTDKKCKIIDVNPGLLESDLSSLTYKEMADILETSEGALKASYHLAVKKIETYLTQD